MHPEEETTPHLHNPHVVRAATGSIPVVTDEYAQLFALKEAAVPALSVVREVGPMRHRAGKDTWGAWLASAVCVAVLIVGALAVRGLL